MNRPIDIAKCKISFSDLVIFFRKIMVMVAQMLKVSFLGSVRISRMLKKLKIIKAFTKLKFKIRSFFKKQLKNQKRKHRKMR